MRMPKASLITFNLASASLAICGCPKEEPKFVGSGVAQTETRNVEAFQAVDFHGQGRLELTAGPLEAIIITGDDNILPILTTTVEDGKLTIRPTREKIEYKTPLVIRAASPGLSEVNSMGSGDIIFQNASGDEVRLSIMGAGEIKAGGKATSVSISIKGAGQVDTTGLEAERVSVTITGAGEADVNAAKDLDVSISGAGTVHYVGDPVVNKKIMGLGTVDKK